MSSNSETRELREIGCRESPTARILRRLIPAIEFGSISIVLPSSERIEWRGTEPGASATVVIHRWRAIGRLVGQGDLGFAESYVEGDWSSPDPLALIEVAARNITLLDRRLSGFLPFRLLNRLRHLLRANSRRGSRKNISYHYDLGNGFYQRWLDRSMTYSSAIYEHPEQVLEDAQEAKQARIAELLGLRGGEQVLEIGCGWGALAIRLARSGARVRGVTLSSEQLAFGRRRVEEENLASMVSLELTDYRDVAGSYDRIVSIEMLEAVGEAYWPLYFRTLHDRLKPGGIAVLQVITIEESRFEAYRRSADLIQRHVFPGGMLPTHRLVGELAASAGLQLVATERFGESYARTLAEWRRRFLLSWREIEAMGFKESFRRLWEYQLSYCEAGFKTGTIDVGFYVLARN